MAPYLLAVVDRVRGEWQTDQRRNIEAMAEAAADAAGWSAGELGDQMGRSPRTRLLTATAAEGAAKTAWPPKVLALGKVLADGLIADDDAVVDHAGFALTAMTALERPHLVLLDLLANVGPPRMYDRRSYEPVMEEGSDRVYGWGELELLAERPQLRPVLRSVVAMLETHALIQQAEARRNELPSFRRRGLELTDLGHQVLDYFREAGSDSVG
jgi:hypothetical protein